MGARLLVIMHEDDCPPGWFGEWFVEAGLTYDAWPAHREALPPTLSGYDGLVVLGGEMGAYDDADHPWLTATKQLIVDAAVAAVPFLGICLGHQLAAVALGGEVRLNVNGHARGLTPLGLTAAGRDDDLLGVVDPSTPALQWNNDVVAVLPAGAVELARSPDGSVQAARFGSRAWGVQFHPEAGLDIFHAWTKARPDQPLPVGVDVDAAYDAVRRGESALRMGWRPLAVRFGEIVVGARVS